MIDYTRQKAWNQRCMDDPECKERRKQSASRWRQKCMADPECKERKKQVKKRVEYKLKQEGRCVDCGKPAVTGKLRCDMHATIARLRGRMHGWLQKCGAVEILGGSCVLCGQSDVRILEFDHINNDGKQHREELKVMGGSSMMMRWILKNQEEAKDRIQVLCANCHAYKRYERSMI